MKKKSARMPKNVDGDGDHQSFFHICVMNERVRLQVNAGDVFFTKDLRTLRKMARFFDKAADYLRDSR